MRSPGARRMIHTRVRSVSDSSVEPTQGFGLLTSRANSAAISADHCDLSFFSAALSSMVRAMRIPPVLFALIYRADSSLKGNTISPHWKGWCDGRRLHTTDGCGAGEDRAWTT